MSSIQILLVDDHDVVRTGLKTFLETQEGFTVVAEANSGEAAIEAAVEWSPDVIVMDITMPKMDGLEATRQILQRLPGQKVLALTVHEDKEYLFEMLAAGACGYVTKQAAAEELVAAIRAVVDGNVYLQPVLARWLLDDYRRLLGEHQPVNEAVVENEDHIKAFDLLSSRERQVLERVAEGLTNYQIGEQLGISPKTVARHRERIMNKLNLHSSTELVKFAIRSGLIQVR